MKIINIFLILFVFNIAKAQEIYKQPLSGIKKVNIETSTSVKIIKGASNNIIISTYKNCKECRNRPDSDYRRIPKNTSDKSKGLKVFNPGGDNTGEGFRIEKEGGVLKIKDLKSFHQRGPLLISLPDGIDITLNCGLRGSAIIEGFSSELEITTDDGHIILTKTTGPITCNSLSGNITMKIDEINPKSPISITNDGGDTDFALPVNSNIDLYLYTYAGTIFTNLDLKVDPSKVEMKSVVSKSKIVSKLNKGGTNIKIYSTSGDIFLRKKE